MEIDIRLNIRVLEISPHVCNHNNDGREDRRGSSLRKKASAQEERIGITELGCGRCPYLISS